MKMTKADITEYYARRAAEYERIYLKPERQGDLKNLQALLAGSFRGLNLLEIACGGSVEKFSNANGVHRTY